MTKYLVDLDAENEPTLWRMAGQGPNWIAMIRRCDVGGEVWELLMRGLDDYDREG